ncbi:Protein-tyrosine phosphatase, partial [Ancylostoma caninum]
GKKTKRQQRKKEGTAAPVAEDSTQKQKQAKPGGENKEDTTQTERKKKAAGPGQGSAKIPGKASRLSVNPEVEKTVEKFVKHATESGIDALRDESRAVLEFLPAPDTCKKFASNPDRNRFPEIQCLDETCIALEQTEPTTNTYIHANRVKLEKADRPYILTQGPKENTIEDFWRMIFQEQCAGVVMLCNYYEDGVQKCDEFFPTENGGYKYYGKMFVNNKKVTMAPVAVVSGAGVGRAGTYIAIDQVCTRLFKGIEVSVKEITIEIRKQRAHAISNELQYFFVYSTVLDYIRAKIPKYHNVVSKFYNELSQAI